MRRTRTAIFSAIVAATLWSLAPIATERVLAQDHDHDHAPADQHDQHEAGAHTHAAAAALKNPDDIIYATPVALSVPVLRDSILALDAFSRALD